MNKLAERGCCNNFFIADIKTFFLMSIHNDKAQNNFNCLKCINERQNNLYSVEHYFTGSASRKN